MSEHITNQLLSRYGEGHMYGHTCPELRRGIVVHLRRSLGGETFADHGSFDVLETTIIKKLPNIESKPNEKLEKNQQFFQDWKMLNTMAVRPR